MVKSFDTYMFWMLALYFDFKVLPWGFGGRWRILGRVRHLDLDLPMFIILAPSLDYEGVKTIYVLKVLIQSFEGNWRFLTWVWHCDLALDMVIGLGYTHVPD